MTGTHFGKHFSFSLYSPTLSVSLMFPHTLFHFPFTFSFTFAFPPSRLFSSAVQAELLLLGQGHHGGRLGVPGGHGLFESAEEAAGGGEVSPGDGQAHGQDAGGGGETEPQKVASGRPGQ